MISVFSKICSELLKSVTINSIDREYDCIVYGNNLNQIEKTLNASNKDFFDYPFINAIGVKLNSQQIFSLAKKSSVNFISKQTKVFAQINISKQILHIENFYKNDIFGQDGTIAIIDTGISPHLDFVVPKNRIIKFVDLINGNNFPYDDNGHGTFVASVACGSGLLSNKKYSGIASQASIVAIKALEKNGETGAYKILEAMQWIYDNYKKYNISVVCMSFGSQPLDKNDPLVIGAEALWNLGVVVVVAGGNSGPEMSTIKSPGISSKIITVGGLNDNREAEGTFNEEKFEVAQFSSRGPAFWSYKPDLIAPAVDITGAGIDENYTKMSGTSVATPMIAGVCALLCSKYPKNSPDQIKAKLLKTCKKITNNYNIDGFGLPNLDKIFSKDNF